MADSQEPAQIYKTVHGYLMGIAFGVMLPLGGILIRTGRATAHGLWQIVSYMAVLAGFGIGIWMTHMKNDWKYENGHPIIGIIVVGSLFFIMFGGMQAHRIYQRQGPNSAGTGHKWGARVMITAGFINGGLGLEYAGAERKYIYAYSITGGVLILLWWAFAIRGETRPRPVRASKA